MRRLVSAGLRLHLLLLVLLAAVPAVGLMLHSAQQDRRHAMRQAQDDAQRLAQLTALGQERFIAATHQLLDVAALLPAVRRLDPEACRASFAALLTQYPAYTDFGAVTPAGDRFCSTAVPPGTAPDSVADTSWFQDAITRRGFVLSDYQTTDPTGAPRIIAAAPVLDPEGQLLAVVFAGIDLARLSDLTTTTPMPAGAVTVVLDRHATVLARRPAPDPWLGRSLPDVPLFQAMRAQGTGTARVAGVDGVERLYGFTRLGQPDGQLYLAVGLPTEVALAQINAVLTRNVTIMMLITALALAAAWFGGHLLVVRPVDALLETTRRLAAGDLSARSGWPSGSGELRRLARAVDTLAAALDQREQARARAEAALLQREVRFRSLVQNAADITAILNADGTVSYISPSIHQVLGAHPDELVASTLLTAIHPDDIAQATRAFQALATQTEVPVVALRFRHRDGSWRWLEARMVNLLDQPGVAGIVVNARDVTERHHAETTLRASEARFRAIFEQAAVGMALLNTDGRFVDTNPALHAYLGYPAADLHGRSFTDFTHAADLPANAQLFSELVAGTREHYQMEKRWVRQDGRSVWCRTTAFLTRDAEGRPQFVVGMLEDVDNQRRLAAHLTQAERLSSLGELAAGMAHEINNPLAAVAATAELALRADLTPQLREDLTLIHQETGRAGEIVRTLLRFSRQREPSLEPLQLYAVLDEALALREDRLRRHRVQVIRDVAPVPDILADRDQLLQVFLNLFNNAVDAMKAEEPRRLTITVRPAEVHDDDQVEVSICDSGTGIPADVIGRVFDPFVTTKGPGQGTGLGLSICHGIVSDHGGTITVENNPVSGTCFRLVFPAVATTHPSEPPPAGDGASDRGQVLVIHPDAMAADALAEAARLVGYAAAVLPDGADLPPAGITAALVGPEVPADLLSRLSARTPAVRLIATGPPAGTGWHAVLPPSYRLADLDAALRGASDTESA